MKRILLVLLFLAAVSSAYAADLKVTGDMTVRGIYDQYKADGGAKTESMFFDNNLNIFAALVANENATVFTKLTYDKTGTGMMAGYGGSTLSTSNDTVANGTGTGGEVLNVERAYLNYKFAPFAQVNAGLMGGGQWATTFGDREINVYRVQAIGALSEDMVFILTYEKNAEGGETVSTGNKNDMDVSTYYASARIKAAGLTFLPLIAYGQIGTYANSAKKNPTKMGATLGVNGDFGMIGFESEFAYGTVNYDKLPTAYAPTGLANYSAYGAYVNVFAKIDTMKVGVAGAYASSDKKSGSFEMGDDFNFTVVADDLTWGNGSTGVGACGLVGMTVAKVYGQYTMDKLTVGGAFAYGMATDKNGIINPAVYVAGPGYISNGDRSFWEVDATASYAMDANATYTIAGGYASLEVKGTTTTTDTAYRVYHQMAIKF